MNLVMALFSIIPPVLSQETLVIWWNKSFFPQQDDAFRKIVKKWEKKTGKQAELTFFTLPYHPLKIVAAFDSKIVPDVDFGQVVGVQNAQFAYEDKLLEISELLNPIRHKFIDSALRSTQFLNAKTGKRDTYTFPLMQHGVNIHYWKDMVESVGFQESDVPKAWRPFWDFWGEVQKRLIAKGEKVHGLGLTYSSEASDTFQIFSHFLAAQKIDITDDNGKLFIEDPNVRKGMTLALEDYTRHYKAKHVPPGAISWQDSDNNLSFSARKIVMVVNPSLSIPVSFLGRNDDYYYNKIRTLRWPASIDGSLLPLKISIHSGFIPKDAKNKDLAKDFVRFLLEQENLDLFVKASNGGFFPVLKESYEDPFFVSSDPHRSAVYKNFTENPHRIYEELKDHKYVRFQMENHIGRGLMRILSENWSAERAMDEMFTRMKKIMTE
jgi:multiple sugar transport system substrate-binding protein